GDRAGALGSTAAAPARRAVTGAGAADGGRGVSRRRGDSQGRDDDPAGGAERAAGAGDRGPGVCDRDGSDPAERVGGRAIAQPGGTKSLPRRVAPPALRATSP